MEKQPAIIAEEIHLQKIEVAQTKIDADGFKKSKPSNLTIGHRLLHNLKEKRIKIELAISFRDKSEREFAFFQIDFHFQIENLYRFYTLDQNNAPVFFGPFVGTLLGICASTARGVIFEKLENNGVKNVIIPVISPQKMFAGQKKEK